MVIKEINQFVEAWGYMGVLWGINRSMARVHAFIIMNSEPVDLDQVAKRLNISRGNASMCLKELRNWGVIRRVHLSGDRRDFYVAEQDVWKMFFRIGVERKKREFDPALHALRHILSEADLEQDKKVQLRLTQMEEILSMVNRILNRFLDDADQSRKVLEFLKNFTPK
jgi:HTH-type transcriptional regulator, glycine betaine synthesis regulator